MNPNDNGGANAFENEDQFVPANAINNAGAAVQQFAPVPVFHLQQVYQPQHPQAPSQKNAHKASKTNRNEADDADKNYLQVLSRSLGF